jgi:hypothetical protein
VIYFLACKKKEKKTVPPSSTPVDTEVGAKKDPVTAKKEVSHSSESDDVPMQNTDML